MNTIAKQARDIVQYLEGVVSAFESSRIGSEDYRDKALLVHQNVCALARLHPNWSEARKLILTKHKDDAPPLKEDDPFILIFEYSEHLLRAWHQMKVPHPSVKSLTKGGAAFREALTNLHNECHDLPNKAASKEKYQKTSVSTKSNTQVEAGL